MNRDEKTLVILTPGFPGNEADTTCLPMQQSFTRCLKESNPSLNIIVLSFQYPYFKKKYNWFGTTVISFDGRNKGGLSKLFLRWKLENVLKSINQTTPITGLLSFWMGECALVGKRFAGKRDLKYYCWILGQDAKKENKYPGLIRPNQGELIALSDFLQIEFQKNHGIKPSHVIPAAIDPKQFNGPVKEKDIDILGAGSLIPLKQFDILVEIVAEMKKYFPDIKAILAGDGPEKNKIQSLVAKAGLQSNIEMVGELSHPEVLQLMQRTKVFLHPSSYEGFSGVCLEALSAGAQVISFCKAMNREIEHWHIMGTKEEMNQKTLDILKDPNVEYSPVFPFSMSNTVKAIAGLYGFPD